MNLLRLLALLAPVFVTSDFLFSPGEDVVVDDGVVVDEVEVMDDIRDLKGSKGKGGSSGDEICKPSKGIGPQFCAGKCQELTVFTKLKDFEGEARNNTIQTASVPLYQQLKQGKGNVEVGMYNIVVDPTDVILGSFTFNKNTMINFAGYIVSKIVPITGGSGKVKGAAGYFTIRNSPEGKNQKQYLDLYLCTPS